MTTDLVSFASAKPGSHVQQGPLALEKGRLQGLTLAGHVVLSDALQWRQLANGAAVGHEHALFQIVSKAVARPVGVVGVFLRRFKHWKSSWQDTEMELWPSTLMISKMWSTNRKVVQSETCQSCHMEVIFRDLNF